MAKHDEVAHSLQPLMGAHGGQVADPVIQALKSCEFDEIEPFPDGQVIVGRGAVVDAVQIARVQRFQK